MGSVNINTGEFPSAVGKEGRELLSVIAKWQSIAFLQFREDCQSLIRMIEETDRLRLWEKNIGGFTYNSRDEFLQEKVLIDYDLTEQSLSEIVGRLRNGESVSLTPLPKHGRPTKKEKGDNITFSKERGTSATYTVRRLLRDNPDLAKEVQEGKLSANAAAIKAGFRKPPPTNLDILRLAWCKANDEERSEFLIWLNNQAAA